MSDFSFRYVPLTFISSKSEIKRQIRNTIIFSYLYRQYNQVAEFSDILESTQYGLNAPANELGKHKFLRISDIKEGEVDWNQVPMCFCDDESKYKLFKDDILVARTGGTTGKSFLIKSPPDNAVFAGYLIRLRAKNINPTIIYEFLNSYAYWSQISEMKMGSAQPNVNAQKLKRLKIPLASNEILEGVVKIFQGQKSDLKELSFLINQGLNNYEKTFDLDSIIYEQKNLITKLRETILQEAVQGKLTTKWRSSHPELVSGPNSASELLKRIQAEKQQLIAVKKIRKEKPLPPIEDNEIPYELPEGWVWCRLVEITTLITDGKHGNCQDESNSGYYFLSAKDVQNGKLLYGRARQINFKEFAEVHQRTDLKAGDLCIVNTGATVGKTAVAQDDEKTGRSTFQKSVAVVKVLHQYVDVNYIETFIKAVTPSLLKTSGGSAINNLLLSDMRKLLVPFPSFVEQKAIVEKVNSLMALCDELEQQIDNSQTQIEQLMQSCLKEVFEKT